MVNKYVISIQEYRILLKLILVEIHTKYIPELSATETVDNKVDGWIKDQQKLGDKTEDYHPDWETSQTCAPG